MSDERKVVLVVSLIMYEVFKELQPLNNQELITDADEISEILEQYEISSRRIFHEVTSEKPSVDIFILKAQDDIYNIIDVVQRNMEYILVLSPRDRVVQGIQENYALFMKNNNLGGNSGDGMPNPPKPPSKKVKNKSQSLSTKGIDLGLDDEFDLI